MTGLTIRVLFVVIFAAFVKDAITSGPVSKDGREQTSTEYERDEPATSAKIILWFRNETVLLVLYRPASPASPFSHYKFSIDPPDAKESILYVEKEGEPPQNSQAAFKGLIPGRAYNISVQTISEDEISTAVSAQYRTVPLRSKNITFDKDQITTNSFVVHWEPVTGKSEFDKYQISITNLKPYVLRPKDQPTELEFKDNLKPGETYSVSVKAVSGKVTSWPISAEVTLEPLPVRHLYSVLDEKSGTITISWKPHPDSTQDRYFVSYHDAEKTTGDSKIIATDQTKVELATLLPGRNYSVAVTAVSKNMKSKEASIYVLTSATNAPAKVYLNSMVDDADISWELGRASNKITA